MISAPVTHRSPSKEAADRHAEDRPLIRAWLETSADNAAIVAAIAMSKSLKLRVVAEGVETQGQMMRRFDQGCLLMQGFLFSPAVPGSDFHGLIRNAAGRRHWRVNIGPRRGVTGPEGALDGDPRGLRRGGIENGSSARRARTRTAGNAARGRRNRRGRTERTRRTARSRAQVGHPLHRPRRLMRRATERSRYSTRPCLIA
jgi:hypothetical protein